MLPTSATHRRPAVTVPVLALVAVVALLVAGCGASGGSDVKKLSTSQLHSVLPKAAEVGTGYKVDNSNQNDSKADDKASDAAFKKSCPEAQALGLNDDDKKDDSIETDFTTSDNREIDTSVDPTPTDLQESKLDADIAAINTCKSVTYTDTDQSVVSFSFSATREDTYGDYGVSLSIKGTVKVQGLTIPVTSKGFLYVVDGVGVQVSATSGVDNDSGAPITGDFAKAAPIAKGIEARIKKLAE